MARAGARSMTAACTQSETATLARTRSGLYIHARASARVRACVRSCVRAGMTTVEAYHTFTCIYTYIFVRIYTYDHGRIIKSVYVMEQDGSRIAQYNRRRDGFGPRGGPSRTHECALSRLAWRKKSVSKGLQILLFLFILFIYFKNISFI